MFILHDDVAVAVAGRVVILEKVLTRTFVLLKAGGDIDPFQLAERIGKFMHDVSAELGLGQPPDCAMLLGVRGADKSLWAFEINPSLNPSVCIVTDFTAIVGPPGLCDECRQVAQEIDRDNPQIPFTPEQVAIRMFGAVAAVAGHHPKGVVGIPIRCIIMSRDQIGYRPTPPAG